MKRRYGYRRALLNLEVTLYVKQHKSMVVSLKVKSVCLAATGGVWYYVLSCLISTTSGGRRSDTVRVQQ